MTPYNFSVLFFSFCSFLISLLVWLKRNDAVGKAYFIFSSMAGAWGCFWAITISENVSYDTALWSVRMADLAAIFIPISWLYFVSIFVGKTQKHKRVLRFLLMYSLLLASVSFHPLFIPRLIQTVNFRYYGGIGPLYHFFSVMFFTVVGMGFVELFKKLRETSGNAKTQLQGLIMAPAFGFLGGGMTFLPLYGLDVPQYGLFIMPLYPFVMAYFIMRENLFNIEKLAQAAHRGKLAAIGTLATSINHEIRNPLYVIQGLAGSFIANRQEGIYTSKDQVVEKAEEILVKVGDHATRAMEIMKGFARFAKQTVTENPQTDRVNLNKVLNDITPLVSHELNLERIELVKNIPSDLPEIQADSRHLEEILFNLIVNACQAIKATTASGKISISAFQSKDSVCIEVSDNGPGVAQKLIGHIFEPFYTTKEEGTGLGLYITKQLVERNGGKIAVKSKPGVGTAFVLEFKL